MRISDWSSDVCSSDLCGRFFAANAAGAEHRDPLARETIGVGAPPVGEVAEALGFGLDRAREAAVTDLELVAGVDQQIGRASGRERVGTSVYIWVGAVSLKKKHSQMIFKHKTQH